MHVQSLVLTVFRHQSWKCAGRPEKMSGIELCLACKIWLHAKQETYPLYSPSGTEIKFLV